MRKDYDDSSASSTQVVELIRAGKATRRPRDADRAQAAPLADRLERLTNELVNKAEADMVARIDDEPRGVHRVAAPGHRLRARQHPARARRSATRSRGR